MQPLISLKSHPSNLTIELIIRLRPLTDSHFEKKRYYVAPGTTYDETYTQSYELFSWRWKISRISPIWKIEMHLQTSLCWLHNIGEHEHHEINYALLLSPLVLLQERKVSLFMSYDSTTAGGCTKALRLVTWTVDKGSSTVFAPRFQCNRLRRRALRNVYVKAPFRLLLRRGTSSQTRVATVNAWKTLNPLAASPLPVMSRCKLLFDLCSFPHWYAFAACRKLFPPAVRVTVGIFWAQIDLVFHIFGVAYLKSNLSDEDKSMTFPASGHRK